MRGFYRFIGFWGDSLGNVDVAMGWFVALSVLLQTQILVHLQINTVNLAIVDLLINVPNVCPES